MVARMSSRNRGPGNFGRLCSKLADMLEVIENCTYLSVEVLRLRRGRGRGNCDCRSPENFPRPRILTALAEAHAFHRQPRITFPRYYLTYNDIELGTHGLSSGK